jgi:hypothetical protein
MGDTDPALRRIGAPLADVTADQWLLVHKDLRALPRVRHVMDALIRFFQEDRVLIDGRAQKGPAKSRI